MNTSAFRSRWGWLFIVLAAMTWGTDLLFRSPMTAVGLDPALIVFGEHLILTVIFLPALFVERKSFRRLTPQQWAILAFLAVGSSAAATWLYTLAFALGSPLEAILLQKTQPIFVLILAPIFLGERRKPLFLPLAAVAFLGAYLLALGWVSPLEALHDSHWKAAVCAILASALWGAGTVAGRYLSQILSPQGLSGGRFVLALPVLGALLLMHPAAAATFGHFRPSLGIDWIFLAVLPGLSGMLLYYYGIATTPASVATLAELTYPATAIVAGYVMFHQSLNLPQTVGLLIVLVAVQLIARSSAVDAAASTNSGQTPAMEAA